MSERFVGIDVGGTHVRSCNHATGDEAHPVLERSIGLPADYGAFLDALADMAGRNPAGIGVGLPGRVVRGSAAWVPNVPYLDGKQLAGDLSARTGAPVRLVNDGQAALLGEARFGAARDVRDALLVSVGTGIGGAVMLDRRIVAGAHGTAGAFGWLCAGTPHLEDQPAQQGPWERTASGTALSRAAAALRPPLEAARLLVAARQGREDAKTVLDRFVRDLGAGLAALASIFDPQRILVSGGVSELVGELLPELTDQVARRASPSVRDVEIAVARHGPRAGAFGAAIVAREREGAFVA